MRSFLEAAAKVLMIGIEGQELSAEEKEFLKKCRPAGVILFGRNIDQQNHRKLAHLTQEISVLCGCLDENKKVLIGVDQEGGRVARIKGDFPNLGPALQIDFGSTKPDSLERIRNYGLEVGSALLKLGINLNFTPVVDILTEPLNVAIGDRCFGKTPEEVILRAGAYLEGLTKAGVWGCLKHFPGQGHARIDTHVGTANINIDLPTLKTREFLPFLALNPQAPLVMVAHGIYPFLDSKEASRSAKIMKDLLREEMGYNGVIVTDDMLMGAMPQEPEKWTQALVESILSGADLLLVCKGLDRAHLAWTALAEKAKTDPEFYRILKIRAENIDKLPKLLGAQ